jgi:hypothetical protein
MTLWETAPVFLGKQHKRIVVEVAIPVKAVMTEQKAVIQVIGVIAVMIAMTREIAMKAVTTRAIAVLAAKEVMAGATIAVTAVTVRVLTLALTWMSILSPKVTLSMLSNLLEELELGPLMQQSGLVLDMEVIAAAAAAAMRRLKTMPQFP